jgi:hypothetical protein
VKVNYITACAAEEKAGKIQPTPARRHCSVNGVQSDATEGYSSNDVLLPEVRHVHTQSLTEFFLSLTG